MSRVGDEKPGTCLQIAHYIKNVRKYNLITT